ncbi:MAG: LysM peptidoglycan-binding domain-containing M23 family metallopeptidase [Pseudomonadota bacterium]|nr:LysM peptidoglycan-binding domain-containing M23 family metallopeptidase [Pseudomonadota bacterium]
MTRVAVLVLAAALLAACGGGGSGPQIRLFDSSSVKSGGQGTSQSVGSSSSAPVAPTQGNIHTVRRGETLYAISRGYGVPLRALIVENALRPPYDLRVGQQLRIPAARTHTVRTGETVYGISRQYGVAMNELVRVNQMAPPYTIKVGQRLSVPSSTVPRATYVSTDPAAPPPRPEPIPNAPGNPEPSAIAPSVEPLPESPPPNSSGDDVPVLEASPEPAPSQLPSQPPPEPSFGPRDVIYPPAKPYEPPRLVGPIPRPPPMTGNGFLWPVRGNVVSAYGPKGRGLHNDGINIAAPRGSPIRAAEAGVVAYAGDGLQGFGNIVLIKHADGYVTAYAHADALLVSRGQVIQRGQAIARVGSSGTVETPQVHFQIRRGRDAIDPRRLLLTS